MPESRRHRAIREMKHCNKCNTLKSFDEFNKRKMVKDGHQPWCKQCNILQGKLYYHKNKLSILKKQKTYQQANKEYINNYSKNYRIKNAEKIKTTQANYYKINKNYIIKRQIKRATKLRQTDPIFNLTDRIRRRINESLKNKGVYKEYRTIEYLGCSWLELKQHLESQFVTGMCWKTRHLWHIDHIIPLALFDLTNEEERLFAFSYVNLQPLWAKENLQKGGR
jgi:hypothetical protein